MQYSDEKDYIMRMIKEAVRILFSVMVGKKYVQVELEEENKCQVSGKSLDEYKMMVDRGEINEAENILLDDLDYSRKEELEAAILFYQYVGRKEEEFLEIHHYSKEEVLEGLKMLAERAGYKEILS